MNTYYDARPPPAPDDGNPNTTMVIITRVPMNTYCDARPLQLV